MAEYPMTLMVTAEDAHLAGLAVAAYLELVDRLREVFPLEDISRRADLERISARLRRDAGFDAALREEFLRGRDPS